MPVVLALERPPLLVQTLEHNAHAISCTTTTLPPRQRKCAHQAVSVATFPCLCVDLLCLSVSVWRRKQGPEGGGGEGGRGGGRKPPSSHLSQERLLLRAERDPMTGKVGDTAGQADATR